MSNIFATNRYSMYLYKKLQIMKNLLIILAIYFLNIFAISAQEYDDVYFTAADRKKIIAEKKQIEFNRNQEQSQNKNSKFANPDYQASNTSQNCNSMNYYRNPNSQINSPNTFNYLYGNAYAMSFYNQFNGFNASNPWIDPYVMGNYSPYNAPYSNWNDPMNQFYNPNVYRNNSWANLFWSPSVSWSSMYGMSANLNNFGFNNFYNNGFNNYNWFNQNPYNYANSKINVSYSDPTPQRGVYYGSRTDRSGEVSQQNGATDFRNNRGNQGGRTEQNNNRNSSNYEYNTSNDQNQRGRSNGNSNNNYNSSGSYDNGYNSRTSGFDNNSNRNSNSNFGGIFDNGGGRSSGFGGGNSGSFGGGSDSGSRGGGGNSGGGNSGGGGGRGRGDQ